MKASAVERLLGDLVREVRGLRGDVKKWRRATVGMVQDVRGELDLFKAEVRARLDDLERRTL